MSKFFKFSNNNIICHHSVDEHPEQIKFNMHTHTDCEIFYFLGGEGNYYIEGNKYPLLPGDVLITNNTESHFIELNTKIPYERFALHFKKNFIQTLDQGQLLLAPFENREPGKYNLLRSENPDSEMYIVLLNNMMAETSNRGLQLETNLFPLLNEILIAFNNSGFQKVEGGKTSAQQIARYINENLENQISLDDICDKFFLSKSQLCRLFKKNFGSSVWSYITIKRLVAAQNMLDIGCAPSRVYSECGFSDYSVFFRAYKRYFGKSPSQGIKKQH